MRSRTNQSLCDYHTRRAEELEEKVRPSLLDSVLPLALNGGSPGDPEANITRLRDKVRRLDKRLEQYLDSAAGGALNPEKLQTAAIALATQQLQIEDKLQEASKQAELQASEEERRQHIEKNLRKLREEWSDLPFEEKQELIREGLERITCKDDDTHLAPRA